MLSSSFVYKTHSEREREREREKGRDAGMTDEMAVETIPYPAEKAISLIYFILFYCLPIPAEMEGFHRPMEEICGARNLDGDGNGNVSFP